MRIILFFLILVLALKAPVPVFAQTPEPGFRLSAPAEFTDTGLLDYLLPRFSLKTGIQVTLVGEGDAAEAAFNRSDNGTAVISGPQYTWYLLLSDEPGVTHADRFLQWLTSDAGSGTIVSFRPQGSALFAALPQDSSAANSPILEGDIALGEELSQKYCSRCHAVGVQNRMGAFDATPSFAVLRGISDWEHRFRTFYALRPHPAFTRIEGVTKPSGTEGPRQNAPLMLTQAELDAILAYVSSVEPADLGAPIQHQ